MPVRDQGFGPGSLCVHLLAHFLSEINPNQGERNPDQTANNPPQHVNVRSVVVIQTQKTLTDSPCVMNHRIE